MKFSTTSLARAYSRHAGRILAGWGVVVMGSIMALVLVLTEFTTDATVTNNPESEPADERVLAAFPPYPDRDRNLYLPRWLQWLPHLEVEGRVEPERQPSLV